MSKFFDFFKTLGCYPPEYNRAVHGPYNPGTYYGKPDTPLSEVKLSELLDWLKRRNYHPRAMIDCTNRFFWRWKNKNNNPVLATSRFFFQLLLMYSLFSYFSKYKSLSKCNR